MGTRRGMLMVFIQLSGPVAAQPYTAMHVTFCTTCPSPNFFTISKKNWIVRVCYELNRQLTRDERVELGQGYYIEHKKRPNILQTLLNNWKYVHGRK
jgi:hypothetical protein